jgi:osmotically-inducible protein OsmY
MSSAQITKIIPDQISRCDEQSQIIEHGKSLSPVEKKDAALKEDIASALWRDDVLRALEYHEIDIHVKNGMVTLNGHIAGSSSQNRIKNAIRAVPGIVEIKNSLVLDDKLMLDVAAALGNLEQSYNCKFFTGASHGVISLNGTVRNEHVKLLAEKFAADNPHTRGVINNVQVSGAGLDLQDQPFLQPVIGETIYFLDWVSGVVKQVIINPNNRRVIAMVIKGKFTGQQYEPNSPADGKARRPERLFVVPMSTVRYLTRVSGFLSINSSERDRYMDFDPGYLVAPDTGWVPPYPYCPEDVLFPVSHQQQAGEKMEILPIWAQSILLAKEQAYSEEHLANDSLGG